MTTPLVDTAKLAHLTDEQVGRDWCAANGKQPTRIGCIDGHWVLGDNDGGAYHWWAGKDRPFLMDPDSELPPSVYAELPPFMLATKTPNPYPAVVGMYGNQSAAYAALGVALRKLWEFAEQSFRDVERNGQ